MIKLSIVPGAIASLLAHPVIQEPAALAGQATPISFSSAEEAFDKAIDACEQVYAGALRGERSDPSKPGPMTRRGFYMSGSGDEAKVNMLMPAAVGHVFKGNVASGQGVVYIVLTRAPLSCRVGSFDVPQSHIKAMKRLADPTSGWAAQRTASPTNSASMQLFEKTLEKTKATLNVSWPASPSGAGPNGLAAMATMVLEGGASNFQRKNK